MGVHRIVSLKNWSVRHNSIEETIFEARCMLNKVSPMMCFPPTNSFIPYLVRDKGKMQATDLAGVERARLKVPALKMTFVSLNFSPLLNYDFMVFWQEAEMVAALSSSSASKTATMIEMNCKKKIEAATSYYHSLFYANDQAFQHQLFQKHFF